MVQAIQAIQGKLQRIRGVHVMIDKDLADLYNVKVVALHQAVKRNMSRFPADFMFELTTEEMEVFVSLETRTQENEETEDAKVAVAKYAFTKLGMVMLASILQSRQAVDMSIQNVRTFMILRSHGWLQ